MTEKSKIARLVQVELLADGACARLIFSNGSMSEPFDSHESVYAEIGHAEKAGKITQYEVELLVTTFKKFVFPKPASENAGFVVMKLGSSRNDWEDQCGPTVH